MIQTEISPTPSIPMVYTSSKAEDTFALGERLALLLGKGSVVALRGPLGAGKTCLVKGIARGLRVEEEVTSPTYTIVSEYEGELPEKNGLEKESVSFYHIDAYRLNGNDDFSAIGGEEIIFGKGISVIEWSDRIPGFISPGALRVDIGIDGDGKRLISINQEAGK